MRKKEQTQKRCLAMKIFLVLKCFNYQKANRKTIPTYFQMNPNFEFYIKMNMYGRRF